MWSEKSNTVDSNSNYPSLIPNPSKSGGNILSLKRHAQPLKFHFLSEDELEEVPTQDDIGTTTNLASKAVGRQIKKWIHDCNEGHAKCVKAARTTWVPTRLLDLQFGDGTSVRLIDTRYEHTIGPYVTLSHCWGSDDLPGNRCLTTSADTVMLHQTKGIKISDMNSTNFEQAIDVARHINIRYIWIDSLCIVQGPGGNFHTEGQLMHKVYRNSYCNLAAADSANSRGGLFRRREPSDVFQGTFKGNGSSTIFGTTTWRIVAENLWEKELLETHIYTRGWVFQGRSVRFLSNEIICCSLILERMLSPRILHFSRNQIFWDCGMISACETFPSGLPLALDDAASNDRHWRGRLQESSSLAHPPISGIIDNSVEDFWISAVLRYTQCNLTNQVDKTKAIWSIAMLVREVWSEDYGVGVWALAVEEQLSWIVLDVNKSLRSIDLQWRLPSWSWTSVQGAVSLPTRKRQRGCYRVKGFDEEDICFRIKDGPRPMLETNPSYSFSHDVQLGMSKWRKAAEKMHGGALNTARSHSVPIIPHQDVAGDTDKLNIEAKSAPVTVPRDLEPELQSKSIAIKAPITPGTLHHEEKTGEYTFVVHLHDKSAAQVTATSNSSNAIVATESSTLVASKITLTAYPDSPPELSDFSPNLSYILVLTARIHIATDSIYDYDSDNEPELELPQTYSGTGLLITPTTHYLQQHHGFPADTAAVETKIAETKDAWKLENAKKDLEGLKTWIGELGREGHWRRTGMVKFEGWSEEAWDDVMGCGIKEVMWAQRGDGRGGRKKYPEGWGTEFWLD
jgi:hypothetical protein